MPSVSDRAPEYGPVSDGPDPSSTFQSSSPMAGGVGDQSEEFLTRARMQVAMRRRAAARAHSQANPNQSQVDPSTCAEEPTTQESPPASPEDIAAARDALDSWRTAATKTVVQTERWFAMNYGKFIQKTGSNNRLSWTDGKFFALLEKAGGAGFKKLMSKGAGTALGVELGSKGGPAGIAVGFIVGKLADKIIKTITSAIKGSPGSKQTEAVEEAVGKANDNAQGFFDHVVEGQADIASTFDQLKGKLTDFDSVQNVIDWTQREMADLAAPNPGDLSLFESMYSDWVLEHAGEPDFWGHANAGDGVDAQQWQAGAAHAHPDGVQSRGDVFAYQTRLQLSQAGLPTEQADALIAEVHTQGTPGTTRPEADGRVLTFRAAQSSTTLLEFLMKHDSAVSENLPDIESGQFVLRCTLDVSSNVANGWKWSVTVPHRSTDPLDAGLPASGKRESEFTTHP